MKSFNTHHERAFCFEVTHQSKIGQIRNNEMKQRISTLGNESSSSSRSDDPWGGIFDPEIYGHACATVNVAQALQAGLRPGAGQTKGAKKNYRKGGGVYCGPIKRCAAEFLWYGAQDQVKDHPCFVHRAVCVLKAKADDVRCPKGSSDYQREAGSGTTMVYQVYIMIMHVEDVFAHRDNYGVICYPMLDRYDVWHDPPKDQCTEWIEAQVQGAES